MIYLYSFLWHHLIIALIPVLYWSNLPFSWCLTFCESQKQSFRLALCPFNPTQSNQIDSSTQLQTAERKRDCARERFNRTELEYSPISGSSYCILSSSIRHVPLSSPSSTRAVLNSIIHSTFNYHNHHTNTHTNTNIIMHSHTLAIDLNE